MKGISYLTDEVGQKKAVVIDFDLLKNHNSLVEVLEDIEDEITIRQEESSYDWNDVRENLIERE
ncbi:MAG TPA: hypothetical protein VGN64_22335 [Dyadobacter sp.]|jgi:hypothetical protein|nr:hypothetical protein [Dyadobacter sp.]